MYLNQLKKGEKAIVVNIPEENEISFRLREMGLVPDTSIKVIGKALFGNPIEISFNGYLLSLRKEEAKYIKVKPCRNGSERQE